MRQIHQLFVEQTLRVLLGFKFLLRNRTGIIKNKSLVSSLYIDYNFCTIAQSVLNKLSFFYSNNQFKIFIESAFSNKSDSFRLIGGLIDGILTEDKTTPILVCAVKNDLEKVINQYNQCKKIGVKVLVYIDNGSTDGTLEWLMSKKDIVVYATNETYSSIKKSAWYFKIFSTLGFERWYLVLDSDEVPTYLFDEQIKINRLTQFLEEQGKNIADSFFIDMYSKSYDNGSAKYIDDVSLSSYRYFDNNFYTKATFKGISVKGGFRERVFFDSKWNSGPQLRKTSLIKPTKKYIYGTHFPLPYYKNFDFQPILALKHYKFTEKDLNKLPMIVKDKLYADNSSEYKKYLSNISRLNKIFNENSTEFINSENLLDISIYKNALVKKWIESSEKH